MMKAGGALDHCGSLWRLHDRWRRRGDGFAVAFIVAAVITRLEPHLAQSGAAACSAADTVIAPLIFSENKRGTHLTYMVQKESRAECGSCRANLAGRRACGRRRDEGATVSRRKTPGAQTMGLAYRASPLNRDPSRREMVTLRAELSIAL